MQCGLWLGEGDGMTSKFVYPGITICEDPLICSWLNLEIIQPRPLDLVIIDCGL